MAAAANIRWHWMATDPATTNQGVHPSRPDATAHDTVTVARNQIRPVFGFHTGSRTTSGWATTTARTATTTPTAPAPARTDHAASMARATPATQSSAAPHRAPWPWSSRTGRASSQNSSGPGS